MNDRRATSPTVTPGLLCHDAPNAIGWLCRVFGFAQRPVVPSANGTHARRRGAADRRCSRARRWALLLVLASPAACAQLKPGAAPNIVEISPRLATSGQPTAEALADLRAQGFDAVVYLAPPTVSDAVRDEAAIVGRQGLVFLNIPIRFDAPTEQDLEAFAAVLKGLGERRVLVHCQINLRASSLVFFYRVIAAKEDPARAYDAVAAVWSPESTWKRYLQTMLRKHGVDFEPY
jgi:protein tyrosine phosphatase (PTP) superfamily phosphohydrolase (DUF442 family)